jgi:ribosomal protein S18 acetylase RimI-like enzyme
VHTLGTLEIRDLATADLGEAAAVLGRGMRDNPLHIRVFGADPDRRETRLGRLFDGLLRRHHASYGVIVGAFAANRLVGVCAMIPSERCQPTVSQKLRLLPALVGRGGLGLTLRIMKWTTRWARRDWEASHWHLGPVGVERHLQGQGIGSALLRDFCARMDALPSPAYLETDKPENVRFYERFGFQVVGDALVLGVPTWFMVRTP